MATKKGFSLIELLVVIAIIALLLSIILPALQAAKFQAKVIVCKSNFHQWGLVTAMYAGANSGKFPRFDLPGTGVNTWDVACEFVEVMMEDEELPAETFFCPVQATPEEKDIMASNEKTKDYLHWKHDPAATPDFSLLKYNWWVPRKNAGQWCPTDPADSSSYPDRDTHRNTSFKPIMSDRLGLSKARSSVPDINHKDVSGGHQRNSVLRSTSLLYADGHAETRKSHKIELRYDRGNHYNFY